MEERDTSRLSRLCGIKTTVKQEIASVMVDNKRLIDKNQAYSRPLVPVQQSLVFMPSFFWGRNPYNRNHRPKINYKSEQVCRIDRDEFHIPYSNIHWANSRYQLLDVTTAVISKSVDKRFVGFLKCEARLSRQKNSSCLVVAKFDSLRRPLFTSAPRHLPYLNNTTI